MLANKFQHKQLSKAEMRATQGQGGCGCAKWSKQCYWYNGKRYCGPVYCTQVVIC